MLKISCAAVSVMLVCVLGQAGDDPYEDVWRDVSERVRHREYASADKVLEMALENRALEKLSARIESDRSVVQGLADFEELVNARCAKLKPGDKFKAGTTEYSFVRLDKGAVEESLVVRANGSDREKKFAVKDLDSRAWVNLAESKLDTLTQKDLVVGVFLAFDRFSDGKSARRLFDKAAASGSDVDVWIKRLAAAEDEKKANQSAKKEAGDPIVGHWRIVTDPGGKKERRESVEFRKDGKAVPNHGRWELDDDGETYVWSAQGGGTARLVMSGDELSGKWANGVKIHGSRQAVRATKKK